MDIMRSLLTNKVRDIPSLGDIRKVLLCLICQGLHEHLGKTVEFGVNVTRDLVGAKVGAIRSAAELVS